MSHKNDQRCYSFITLANVGRFSEFSNFSIHRDIAIKLMSCFPPHNYVSTLLCKKLKIPLLSFYHWSCYKNFMYLILSDTYYHNMLLTQQHLPILCEICCEFFVFQQNNVSAKWARTDSMSVSAISDFWNGRHLRLFHQVCGSITQIWTQWTTKFA